MSALFASGGLLTNCSSASIPAGVMGELNEHDGGGGTGGGTGGGGGGGNVTCGNATCAVGQMCCAGADEFCSPTCMAVSHCPAYGRPCRVPDAGACTQSDCAGLPMDQLAKICPDGTTLTANLCKRQADGRCNWDFPECPSGGHADASPAEASTVDASPACCPADFLMYACTYADGQAGLACHNPAMGCASSLTCGQGCDPVVTGRCGSPQLQWYTTCGYPVCRAGVDAGAADAGPACPKIGTPCATQGQGCGTPSDDNCGVTLVCSDHDPKSMGCPISSREFKNGISYLDDAELERLHDETLGIRLATYNYDSRVADPHPTHLGFIIEDAPETPAADTARHRVDLYGYMSMVVATMQVQEKEMADLRKELAATRSSCRAPRK
jgi:hypothetical protein